MHAVWKRRLPAILFVAVASYLFLRTQAYRPPRNVHMADLQIVNLDGSRFDSTKLAGKALVVNFWAPWCGPCRLEMPWLEKIQRDNPELVVLGVEDDPDQYRNADLMEGRGRITYPLVQESASVRQAFGHVLSLPTTLYISPSGRVVHSVSGLIPERLISHYAKEAISTP